MQRGVCGVNGRAGVPHEKHDHVYRCEPGLDDTVQRSHGPKAEKRGAVAVLQQFPTVPPAASEVVDKPWESGSMSRYFFHVRSEGPLSRDKRGREFRDARAACEHAIRSTPTLLRDALQSAKTHVTTQICEEEQRTVCVVRGSIISEIKRHSSSQLRVERVARDCLKCTSQPYDQEPQIGRLPPLLPQEGPENR